MSTEPHQTGSSSSGPPKSVRARARGARGERAESPEHPLDPRRRRSGRRVAPGHRITGRRGERTADRDATTRLATITDLASELSVSHVLAGSVRRAGNNSRDDPTGPWHPDEPRFVGVLPPGGGPPRRSVADLPDDAAREPGAAALSRVDLCSVGTEGGGESDACGTSAGQDVTATGPGAAPVANRASRNESAPSTGRVRGRRAVRTDPAASARPRRAARCPPHAGPPRSA
jgi:hypothetical protein